MRYRANVVTAKAQSESDLASRAYRLETLLENLPGMVYRCLNEPHWPMDFVSNGCFELCGYKKQDIESQRILWGDFTHPEDIDEVDRLVRHAALSEEPFEVEYRIICKNGECKWVWERGRTVGVSEDGIAVIEGFITDITSRKLSKIGLEQARAYSQAIVDSVAEAVVTIDKNGGVESFNRAAENMFACCVTDILGRDCKQLFATSSHREFETFLEQSKNNPDARETCEINGLAGEDRKFPIALSINQIASEHSDKYVILARDLTRQRNGERELREQREMLSHADRLNTLGEMTAGIAHEINQPLTAISMYAQSGLRFMENSALSNARLGDALEKISVQARRAGAVMQRMQAMAKREVLRHENIKCDVLIKEIRRLAELEASSRNYVIHLDIEEQLNDVHCDSVQVQQVILNLLRNGMESMSSAKCAAQSRIILKACNVESGVRLSIIDCGHGINLELAQELYETFRSNKEFGMGLGLSISRSIIRAHGSRLEFKNNLTGGACFYFSLPSARVAR